MAYWSASLDVGWTIVGPGRELDPNLYLGEFGELPSERGEPGEWCDVVVRDSLGEMRWTFVLVGGRSQRVGVTNGDRAAATRPLVPPRPVRRTRARALREWEREDEAAAASSAPFRLRSAGRSDESRSGRRLRLVQSIDFS